jgi:hypothetical protein
MLIDSSTKKETINKMKTLGEGLHAMPWHRRMQQCSTSGAVLCLTRSASLLCKKESQNREEALRDGEKRAAGHRLPVTHTHHPHIGIVISCHAMACSGRQGQDSGECF